MEDRNEEEEERKKDWLLVIVETIEVSDRFKMLDDHHLKQINPWMNQFWTQIISFVFDWFFLRLVATNLIPVRC